MGRWGSGREDCRYEDGVNEHLSMMELQQGRYEDDVNDGVTTKGRYEVGVNYGVTTKGRCEVGVNDDHLSVTVLQQKWRCTAGVGCAPIRLCHGGPAPKSFQRRSYM